MIGFGPGMLHGFVRYVELVFSLFVRGVVLEFRLVVRRVELAFPSVVLTKKDATKW
jgi:hypothetical protein